MDDERKLLENLKAELAKMGIYTAEDLQRAIDELPPLGLGIMTGEIGGMDGH